MDHGLSKNFEIFHVKLSENENDLNELVIEEIDIVVFSFGFSGEG